MSSPRVLLAFDSGVGGLSALAPLLQKHQGLEVFYFGDLAHLPYGNKTRASVRELVHSGFSKLASYVFSQNKNPSAGILACNTASAQALDIAQELGQRSPYFPVVGVIESGCASVLKGQGQRIIILGTQGTVNSEAYPLSLKRMGCEKAILQKACPLFVPLVEEHLLSGAGAEWIVDHYLNDLLKPEDDVVLGCTHYPFLQPLLEKKFPHCRFFDAGSALLENPELAQLRQSGSQEPNSIHFLFTDESVSSSSLFSLLSRCGLGDLRWTQMRV